MANEPERPIEQLLRACARKRREEAKDAGAFALHPATRRWLQGEVARRFGRRAPARGGAARGWAAAFWPRLVEACVLVALFAVVGSVLVPAWRQPRADVRLALSKPAPRALRQTQPSAAPALAAAPVAADQESKLLAERERLAATELAASNKDLQGSRREATRRDLDQAPAPAVGATVASNEPKAPDTTLAQKTWKLEPAAPSSPPVPAAPSVAAAKDSSAAVTEEPSHKPTAPSAVNGGPQLGWQAQTLAAGQGQKAATALADGRVATNVSAGALVAGPLGGQAGTAAQNSVDLLKQEKGAVVLQRFAQVPPVAKAQALAESKAGPAILASFQVEQAGRELRVIDSDGSVYTGAVLVAEAPRRAQTLERRAPSEAPAEDKASPQRSFFAKAVPSAPQTNVRFFRVRGTNQSLNQPVVFNGTLTDLTNAPTPWKLAGAAAAAPPAGQPAPALLLNSRISGQAVIGPGQVVDVNAVPAP